MLTDFVNTVTSWEFLNEPLYRWWLFFLALALSAFAWNGILEFMK